MEPIDELEYDLCKCEFEGIGSNDNSSKVDSAEGIMLRMDGTWYFLSHSDHFNGDASSRAYEKANKNGFNFNRSWNLGFKFRDYLTAYGHKLTFIS